MDIHRKNKLIQLLQIWGNTKILVKNYKMEFTEIMEICKNLKDVRALCYENMSQSKNKKIVSSVENSTINSLKFYENKIKHLTNRLNKNMQTKELMESYIKMLEPNEQAILRARFVEQVKWEHVPARLAVGCSLRQCYRTYDTALEKLNNMMDEKLFIAND